MPLDSLVSLVLGIPIGLVSGLYTGLFVARYSRFSELRNEVLRAIRSINFIENKQTIDIINDRDVKNLPLIASDLLFLGHRVAGEHVLRLSQDVTTTNYSAKHGRVTIDQYTEKYSNWQNVGRQLPGNKAVLWSLWGRI